MQQILHNIDTSGQLNNFKTDVLYKNSLKMSMSQWNHGMKQGHEFHVYVAKITPFPSQHLLAVVNIENN